MGVGPFAMAGKFLKGASGGRGQAPPVRKRNHGSGTTEAEGRERKHGLRQREGSGRGQREGSGRGQAPPVRRGYARKRRAVSEQIGTALRYCSWFPNTQGEELQNKNGLRCLLAGKSWREGKSLPCVWMRVSGG